VVGLCGWGDGGVTTPEVISSRVVRSLVGPC
jgi:hypothetical protein